MSSKASSKTTGGNVEEKTLNLSFRTQWEVIYFGLLSCLSAVPAARRRASSLPLVWTFVNGLQLLAVLFDPTIFKWEEHGSLVGSFLSLSQLRMFTTGSYRAFVIHFWIVIAVVVTMVAAVSYCSFHLSTQNATGFRCTATYYLLYCVCRLLFLSFLFTLFQTLSCFDNTLMTLRFFPTVRCLHTPHVAFVVVALLAILVMLFLSFSLCLMQVSISFKTLRHGNCSSVVFPCIYVLVQTTVVALASLLPHRPVVLSLCCLLLYACLFLWVVILPPYYSDASNKVSAAVLLSLTVAASVAVSVASMQPGTRAGKEHSISVFVLVPLSFVFGYFLSHWRASLLNKQTLGVNDAETGMWEFSGFFLKYPWGFELASRIIRLRNEPFHVDMLGAMLKKFQAVHNESPLYHLLYADYLFNFREGALEEAEMHLEMVKALDPSIDQRFACLRMRKDQDKKRRSDSTGLENLDLSSYLDFQRQYRLARRYHNKTIRALNSFWQAVPRDDLFDVFTDRVQAVARNEGLADGFYKMLLGKYPKSLRVLRSYGYFLETVKNSPLADEYYQKADRLEDQGSKIEKSASNHGARSIVSIDEMGIIKTMSPAALEQFGYTKDEIVGQNVKILMPSPYCHEHDGYLQRYRNGGKASMLGNTREVECLHKDGACFSANLSIVKMQTGKGPVYVGSFKPIEDTSATASINDKGVILAVNHRMLDMFGWSLDEMIGKNISMLMDAETARAHDSYLERYYRTGVSTVLNKAGRALVGKHKDGTPVPIALNVVQREEKVFHGRLTAMEGTAASATINIRGIIQSCNRMFLVLFGYESIDSVQGQNINIIMPPPYDQFHDEYLRKYEQTGVAWVLGTEGRVVKAKHSDGATFFVLLKVVEIESDGDDRLFTGQLTFMGKGKDEDEVAQVSIDRQGTILSLNREMCDLFGYQTNELLGENVKVLMPPVFREQHDQFLADYFSRNDGKSSIVGNKGRSMVAEHKSGEHFPVSLKVKRVDVGSVVTFEGSFVPLANTDGIVVIDGLGIIQSVSQGVCNMFGYTEAQLTGANVKILMEERIAVNHDYYLKRYSKTKEATVVGTERVVRALHSDKSLFRVSIQVSESLVGEKTVFTGRIKFLGKIDATEEQGEVDSPFLEDERTLTPTPTSVVFSEDLPSARLREGSLLAGQATKITSEVEELSPYSGESLNLDGMGEEICDDEETRSVAASSVVQSVHSNKSLVSHRKLQRLQQLKSPIVALLVSRIHAGLFVTLLCCIFALVLFNQQQVVFDDYLTDVKLSVERLVWSQEAVLTSRRLQQAVAVGDYGVAAGIQTELTNIANAFDAAHNIMYLGPQYTKMGPVFPDQLRISDYPAVGVYYSERLSPWGFSGLWQLGSWFSHCVLMLGSANTTQLDPETNRYWNFVMTNGPYNFYDLLERSQTVYESGIHSVLLNIRAMQGGIAAVFGLCVLCLALLFIPLALQVSKARIDVIRVFKDVPPGVVRSLSKRTISISENSDSEEEEMFDIKDFHEKTEAQSHMTFDARNRRSLAGDDRLERNMHFARCAYLRQVLLRTFCGAFLLVLLVGMSYFASVQYQDDMELSGVAMSFAGKRNFLAVRVRYFAMEFMSLAQSFCGSDQYSASAHAGLGLLKAHVDFEYQRLQYIHAHLLAGDVKAHDVAADRVLLFGALSNDSFPVPVDEFSSVYSVSDRQRDMGFEQTFARQTELLFSPECLTVNVRPDLCLTADDGDYAAVSQGLDIMVRHYLHRAAIVAQACDNATESHDLSNLQEQMHKSLAFINRYQASHLSIGLNASLGLYHDHAMSSSTACRVVQSLLLSSCLLLSLALYFLVFRSMASALQLEVARAREILFLVPLDVINRTACIRDLLFHERHKAKVD